MPLTRRALLTLAALMLSAVPAAAAPTLSILAPANGTITRASDIQVVARASADAICAEATVAGVTVPLSQAGPGGDFTGIVSGVPEGATEASVRAWDAAGCVERLPFTAGRAAVDLTVDQSPPEPFAFNQARTTCAPITAGVFMWGAGDPTVCWALSSDRHSGIVGHEVWINGVNRTDLGLSAASNRAVLAGLPAGTHSLQVFAVDGAGLKTAASGANLVLVDRTSPTVSWLQPAPKTVWLRRRVALTVNTRDLGGAGLSRIVFSSRRPLEPGGVPRADLGQVDNPNLPAAKRRIFLDTTRIADGRHEWSATTVDAVGNLRTVRRVVRVDNTKPRFARGKRTITIRGRGARTALVRVRDVASPKVRTRIVIKRGRAAIHRSPFRLARDTDVQKVRIPASVRSGRYSVTVQVKDLAGNMSTKAFPLIVRR